MSDLVRFGVSIPRPLLEAFDQLIESKGYPNRSEAIRDLVRDALSEARWEAQGEGAGGIVLVYDHHKKELTDRLVEIQHDALDLVVSTLHVHLDHHRCLEVIVVRGPAERIGRLADRLRSLKGVIYCSTARIGVDQEGAAIPAPPRTASR
jgi:CopG family transcriptional regulator, nickel-responsive regulator